MPSQAKWTESRPPLIYDLFGDSLVSELALPLPESTRPPSVEVTLGKVRTTGKLVWSDPPPYTFSCYIDGDDAVLIWPEARFLVTPSCVVVDADDQAAAVDLLVPAVWSVVLAVRGQETLHGCAVELNGRAVAVLGDSGSGKSTAGRMLRERGWRLVTDDMLAFGSTGVLLPGPPFQRMVPDDVGEGQDRLDTGGKIRLAVPTCRSSVRLKLMIVLAPEYEGAHRLTGAAAASALLSQIYNPLPIRRDHLKRRFDLVLDLAAAVPIFGAAPRTLTVGVLDRLISEAFA